MKIVQITPYAMDRPGGVQSNIRDLSAWLRQQGHEVKIIAPPSTDLPGEMRTVEPGVMTVGTARPFSVHGTQFEISHATARSRRETVTALRDWGAEVVHLHTPWTPLMPWQIWRALKLPAIATFHATLPTGSGFDPLAAALRRVGHHFNRHLHRIVVPSEAPFMQWKTAGADPLPLILPPTIDLAPWRAAADEIRKPANFRAVYMGRLEARKGVSVLLTAWHRVQHALPQAQLIIAGTGEEEATLRAQAQDLALANVTFQAPPSQAAAKSLIAGAHAFVAPALHGESFGLVLIEAMAAGAVPVAAANDGFATVLTEAGKSLLCPPGDAVALSETLLHLATSPARYNAARDWARSHAARFDVTTVGPAYETLLQEALLHG
ncbi:glycosyltransferase family 4 protein [Shimia marina]|uniref:GDP-mannose-dependent alpha-(1-2)-phosphatidylinositol mannosyltransferase n=1 Tax=Shimia marina TaxID=321267 RepID=A0A0P1EL92_9RHOB|nr:glycosyltransferase [Shimia marina]CUH51258.1 GDP-mannose-dependent alpha-(1-2)-phosphatidylinositol mannosyltransferase [Shimia marina]SFD53778.1 phosphatidylinositol alpha-mannosyltransferase [Shimia marina]